MKLLFNRKIRNFFLVFQIFIVVLFIFGCPTDKNNSKSELELISITVHGRNVIKGFVTIPNNIVTSADVKVLFKNQNNIPVSVLNAPVKLKDGIETPIILEAKIENRHWQKIIRVKKDSSLKKDIILKQLFIHGMEVQRNNSTWEINLPYEKNQITKENIKVIFEDGINRNVNVRGDTVILFEKITNPVILLIPETDEYKEWSETIYVTKNEAPKAPPAGIWIPDYSNKNLITEVNPIDIEITGFSTYIIVQSSDDVIREVKIDGAIISIEEKLSASGKKFWDARKELILSESIKNIEVEIHPKNLMTYKVIKRVYKIKGKAPEANNTCFKSTIEGKPSVSSTVIFYDGKPHKNNDDYGAKTVKINAETLNPNATVKYALTYDNKNTLPIPGTEGNFTAKSNGVHEAEITLYENKPTNFHAWVVAADGVTTAPVSDKKSHYTFSYNPIILNWDYVMRGPSENFVKEAYDIINLTNEDLSKIIGNKIYVCFTLWSSYEIATDNLPPYQKALKELDNPSEYVQRYQSEVDISSLENGSVQELEIILPIREKGVDCFTYKVKIKKV